MKRIISLLTIFCLFVGPAAQAALADAPIEEAPAQDVLSDAPQEVIPDLSDVMQATSPLEEGTVCEDVSSVFDPVSDDYAEAAATTEDEVPETPDIFQEEEAMETAEVFQEDAFFEETDIFEDLEEIADEEYEYEALIPEEYETSEEESEAAEDTEYLEDEPATENENLLMTGIPLGELKLYDGMILNTSNYTALIRTLYWAQYLGMIRWSGSGTNDQYDFNKDGVDDLKLENASPYKVTILASPTGKMLNTDTNSDGKNDSYRFSINDDVRAELEDVGNEYYESILLPETFCTLTIDPNGGHWADGSSGKREISIPRAGFLGDTPEFQELSANANFLGLTKTVGGTKYGCTGFASSSTAASAEYGFQLTYGYTGLGNYKAEDSRTLYAVYRPVLTFTFNAGGAHFADGSASKTFEYTEGQKITANKDFYSLCCNKEDYGMVWDGHLFKRLVFAGGSEAFSFLSYQISSYPGYLTVNAEWRKEIHLTIYTNGGTFEPDDISGLFQYGYTDEINPKAGILSGSVMGGEYISVDGRFWKEGYEMKCISEDPAGTKVVEPDSYHRYTIPETETEKVWYIQWEIPEELRVNGPNAVGHPSYYSSISLWPGETAKLYVNASGSNLTYQWRSYSGDKSSPGTGDFTDIPGATSRFFETPEMTIHDENTDNEDKTYYYCVVRDDKGHSKNSSTLCVEPNYGIRTYFSDCICTAGKTAIFHLEAYGKHISYKWSAQDSHSNTVLLTDIPGAAGMGTPTLQIPVTDALDGYRFTCKITYDGGNKECSGKLCIGETIPEVELTISAKPVHRAKASAITGSVPEDKGYSSDPDETFEQIMKAKGEPVTRLGVEGGAPANLRVRTIDRGWYLYYFDVDADTGKGFDPAVTKIKVNGPAPDRILTEYYGSFLRCALYYYVFDEISDSDITMPAESFEYTGSAVTPEPFISQDGMTLTKGKDYTLAYTNNVNAGTATIAITGMGETPGTMIRTFSIIPSSLSGASISASQLIYSGRAREPGFTIIKNGRTLNQGIDFTVSGYENNINAGPASAVLTGKGNYTGTLTQTYTISPLQLTKNNVSLPDQLYSGTALTPPPAIEADDTDLKEGVDYTVKYQNNVKAGTASATITGTGGNCIGTVTKQFVIGKAYDTITAKNIAVSTKLKKKQRVKLGASTIGGKLTYASSNKLIKVTKAGKLTIPKGFVGKTTVTLTSAATDNCKECVKKITVTVNPEAARLSRVKNNAGGKITVKWKKTAGNKVTGFEIAVADNAEFENARSVKAKGAGTLSRIVPKMVKGKTYYVKVRSYQKAEGKIYYSEWSNIKQVMINK